jgi:hypothetical protein
VEGIGEAAGRGELGLASLGDGADGAIGGLEVELGRGGSDDSNEKEELELREERRGMGESEGKGGERGQVRQPTIFVVKNESKVRSAATPFAPKITDRD